MARCKGCIHDKVCNMWAVDSGIPFVNADTCEHYKPTADVVPKSVVDELLTRLNNVYVAIDIAEGDVYRLEKENDELKDTNQHLFEFIAEVKREIAIEIFEEIDKILLFGTEHICSSDYSFYRDYAELKKKYTEEQT